MHHPDPTRRGMLLASLTLPWLSSLQGCGAPLPLMKNPRSSEPAHDRLLECASAHGLTAYRQLHDVSVRYEGHWRPVVGRLQPALVDAGFRGGSEERLLLDEGIVAQTHGGPSGAKQVVRRLPPGARDDVRVWFNGGESHDADARAAAALVVDGYSLFLFGPLLLADRWSRERTLIMELAGSETLRLDRHEVDCDVLRMQLAPGLGFSGADQLSLFIDRRQHLMRAVRFTLNGLESTQGAIAEVQTFDHRWLYGVQWPTRFHERLLRPVPLPVHDWRLTGLDANRGMRPVDVTGAEFDGRARAPAAALAPA